MPDAIPSDKKRKGFKILRTTGSRSQHVKALEISILSYLKEGWELYGELKHIRLYSGCYLVQYIILK